MLTEQQEKQIRDEIGSINDMPGLLSDQRPGDLAGEMLRERRQIEIGWLITCYRNIHNILQENP